MHIKGIPNYIIILKLDIGIEDGNYSASIENLGYEMLDLYAAGFENNEGGNGTIFFNLKDKEMNLEYYQNYEESIIGSSEEIRLV